MIYECWLVFRFLYYSFPTCCYIVPLWDGLAQFVLMY